MMVKHTKPACLVLTLACLSLFANAESPERTDLDFDEVDTAVAHARKELAGKGDTSAGGQFPGCGKVARLKPSINWAAVVIKFTYSDDMRKSAEMRINAHSKNTGLKLPPDTARVYFVYVDDKKIKFQLSHRGYHTITRSFDLAQGEVRVLDDLVLERLTKQNGVKVVGRVWLEGDGDLSNITVMGGPAQTKTDDKGRFQLYGVPTGDFYLSAKKDGFVFSNRRIHIRDETKRVIVLDDLKGHLLRSVLVRWAFQPNGTRNLADGLEGDTSLIGNDIQLAGEVRTRISVGNELAYEDRKYDFEMLQRGDTLLFYPQSAYGKTELLRIPDISFAEIQQAPSAQYTRLATQFEEGDVIIFKNLNGDYYGKFEILDIVAGEKARERVLADLARKPLE